MELETADKVTYVEGAQPPTSDLEITMSDANRRGRNQSNPMPEVLSRTKRIETRLTQMMIAMGIPTNAQKPEFSPVESRLSVPSPHTSLRECLNAIPSHWDQPVTVAIGDEVLATLVR